jgi:hypothetical protein
MSKQSVETLYRKQIQFRMTIGLLAVFFASTIAHSAPKNPPAKALKTPKASTQPAKLNSPTKANDSSIKRPKNDPLSDLDSDTTTKTVDDGNKKPRDIKATRHEPGSVSASQTKRFGVGLDLGSNAIYGNGVVGHYDLLHYLDLQFGVGYNTTGIKLGFGSALILPVTPRFGFDFGAALVHSNGTKDKVSLDAKFTPNDTSNEEKVKATKEFKTSPANYISGLAGLFFDVTPMFRLLAHANFNKVLSGNVVELSETTEYDQAIDATNEAEVESSFQNKANDKLSISGLGFSAGVQFRF